MNILPSIQSIIDKYNFFIVDIWGVLHNGVAPYPRSIEAMLELKKTGKVMLLSNAPRRAEKVAEYLVTLGFISGIHYDGIMTSGEVFHRHIARQQYDMLFYIGPAKDVNQSSQTLMGTDIAVTYNLDSDFQAAVVTGPTNAFDLSYDMSTLEALVTKGTKLFCPNPDMIVDVGGSPQFCAGATAAEYKKLGGEVVYFGKPYISSYNAAFDEFLKLDAAFNKARCLAIGDGMMTDILGAQNAEIDSVLCTCGIHCKDAQSSDFLDSYKAKPTYMVHAM